MSSRCFNLHIHLIANRIGIRYDVYDTTFPGNRSARAAEEISREMGLTIANEVHRQKQHRAEHTDPMRQAVKERLQQIAYGELGKGYSDIRDFLAALRRQGIQIAPMKNKQGRIYGLRFEYAGQMFKASEIGREFGYRSLLNQFGITARRKNTGKSSMTSKTTNCRSIPPRSTPKYLRLEHSTTTFSRKCRN